MNINYNLVTEDIAGRHYTPQCLGTCDLVFSLSYTGNLAPSSVAVDTNKLQTQFNWIKGQDKLKSSKIYYLNEYQEQVTDYSSICNPYAETDPINGTITEYPNCTQVPSGSHAISKQEWKELSSLTLEKDKTYYIDIRGYFKPVLREGFKVDIIPVINLAGTEFSLNEMAWWSGNWNLKQCFTVTENTGNDLVNMTFNRTMDTAALVSAGKMASNCGDLRVVDEDALSVSPYNFTGCNTNSTNIFWKHPDNFSAFSTRNICMYYNSTASTSASPWRDVFLEYDDFNNASIDSNIWVATGTVTQTGGTIRISNSYSWITNYARTVRKFNQPFKISMAFKSSVTNCYAHTISWRTQADNDVGAGNASVLYQNGGLSPPKLESMISQNGVYTENVMEDDATFWKNGSLIVNTTNMIFSSNDSTPFNKGTGYGNSFPRETMYVTLNTYTCNPFTWDNFTIQTYADPAPAYSSFGSEQSLPYANDSEGNAAIRLGIANSLINSSNITYPNQQVYTANLTGQAWGRFDYVVASGSQRWAFNYVAANESTSGFTGITDMPPVLYVWEASNKTATQITNEVRDLIDSTKQ